MIDPAVEALAGAFIEYTKRTLHEKASYRLDFSLISMTTLDVVLNSHQTPRSLSEADLELIKGAAAYIGIATYACWQEMTPRPKMKLVTRTSSDFEIALEVVQGPLITEGSIIKINLVSTIKRLMEKPPDLFPSFERFIVPRTPHLNIISTFAKGLLSGLSPFLEGPWKNIAVENFAQQLREVSIHLALGVSRYFAFRFSQDQFLSRPAIFTESILLPPIGYKEEFPYIRATQHLIKSLLSLEAQEKDIEQVALHLLTTPDSTLNTLGFILGSAYDFPNLKEFLRAFAASSYLSGHQLRPALHLAKSLLQKKYSYLDCINDEDDKSALAILRSEYRLGLLPLFSEAPTQETICAPLILLEALTANNLNDTLEIFLIQRELKISSFEAFISIQTIYLDALTGKFDQEFIDTFPLLDEKSKESSKFPYVSSYHKIRLLYALHHAGGEELMNVLSAYAEYLIKEDTSSLISAHDSYLFYQATTLIIKYSESSTKLNEGITKLSQIFIRNPELLTPDIFELLCIDQENQMQLLDSLPNEICYMLERAVWSHSIAYLKFKS